MPDGVPKPSRRSVLRSTTLALSLSTGVGATAGTPVGPATPEGNPWPDRRVLTIGHRGGLLEVPENTLFGLKYAAATGQDMVELDLKPTADKVPVVCHDQTVDRTTDGSGRVNDSTLAELHELDAAYWFVEGAGTTRDAEEGRYEYRGYATGDRQLPPGLGTRHGFDVDPRDFRIPTLESALQVASTRDGPISLTISLPTLQERDPPYTLEREVARLLRAYDRVGRDVVAAFDDAAMERFKAEAPEVHTSTDQGRTAAYWASARGPLPGAPQPRYDVLQVPLSYSGIQVVDEEFVADAHANGYAVHVWVVNDPETWDWLVDVGVDGIMTDRPTDLRAFLEERGVAYG